MSPEDAAALPVAAGTAYDALTCLDLAGGATLLVNGAGGGVGVAIVQLARARGITVIGTASPAKHELLAAYGAIPVAYGDGVLDRVRALGPVDAVFDLVGGDALRTVAELAAPKLASVADKVLAQQLGGIEIVRDRSTAVLTELARPGRGRRARPARDGGPPPGRRGGSAGRGGARPRERQGRAPPLIAVQLGGDGPQRGGCCGVAGLAVTWACGSRTSWPGSGRTAPA